MHSNSHFVMEFEFEFGCVEVIETVMMVMVTVSEMTTTRVSTTGKSAEFRIGAAVVVAVPNVPPSFFSEIPPYLHTTGNK